MNKTLLALVLATASLCPLSASAEQQPATETATVEESANQPAQTAEAVIEASEKKVDDAFRDVEETARKYVRNQKRKYKKQGRSNEVFISSGSALVSEPSSSTNWGDARVIAYQEAQNKARESFLKQLYSEVSSDIIKDSFKTNKQPEFEPEDLQSQSKMESVLNKVVAYADAVLDEKLEEKGVDPAEYKSANPEKRKVMLKKAFSKAVTRKSHGDLSGAMIVNTYETTDANGNTAVAVVMKTSVKMKNFLRKLRTSKGVIQPNPKKHGVDIEEYLEVNRENLMYEYGLRMFYDENGYPVLLSFAQAGNDCNPVDYEECVDNRDFSFDEAENDAFSHFAEAYNLNGASETSTFKGKEKTKTNKITKTENGVETTQETINKIIKETKAMSRMTSRVKDLVGISEVMRWTEKHSVSGRELNGVVLAWRPETEQATRTFKANKIPSAPAPQQQTAAPKKNSAQQASSAFLMEDDDF
ncbi:hypothetical protein M3P05_15185 [Sansalvadorimonas sp. 2012CJ34-2]|uniref:DUF6844 domain-containing protein n=1 Tax=Parendozoicomonas callyspongiae TaxID=2942213 RepID=A0ABT0PIR5_9GAMM|nr:hypothetical protein [Sansalvadorimonas sp. 2012CJ34-2]MCL6271269.1 hypothetical protein [Sansalvadorimonas sp. 2012CJ34-2]